MLSKQIPTILCALIISACDAQTETRLDIHHLSGVYPSHIASVYPIDAKTEFFIDEVGKQKGKYYFFEHQQLKLEGVLEKFEVIDAHTVIANWRDAYGTGKLKMKFAPDFSSFEGKWLPDQFRYEDQTQWNMLGVR